MCWADTPEGVRGMQKVTKVLRLLALLLCCVVLCCVTQLVEAGVVDHTLPSRAPQDYVNLNAVQTLGHIAYSAMGLLLIVLVIYGGLIWRLAVTNTQVATALHALEQRLVIRKCLLDDKEYLEELRHPSRPE